MSYSNNSSNANVWKNAFAQKPKTTTVVAALSIGVLAVALQNGGLKRSYHQPNPTKDFFVTEMTAFTPQGEKILVEWVGINCPAQAKIAMEALVDNKEDLSTVMSYSSENGGWMTIFMPTLGDKNAQGEYLDGFYKKSEPNSWQAGKGYKAVYQYRSPGKIGNFNDFVTDGALPLPFKQSADHESAFGHFLLWPNHEEERQRESALKNLDIVNYLADTTERLKNFAKLKEPLCFTPDKDLNKVRKYSELDQPGANLGSEFGAENASSAASSSSLSSTSSSSYTSSPTAANKSDEPAVEAGATIVPVNLKLTASSKKLKPASG